jgi:hypothetical protein
MPQPNQHKYNLRQRLSHAADWIKTYNGKKLHHGYAKHFGVSKLCAVTELEMLGIISPPGLKESIIRSLEDKRKQRENSKNKNQTPLIESDYYFAYIAGYTSGGAPYGITWNEAENFEDNEVVEIQTDFEVHKDDYLEKINIKEGNIKDDENFKEDYDDLPF